MKVQIEIEIPDGDEQMAMDVYSDLEEYAERWRLGYRVTWWRNENEPAHWMRWVRIDKKGKPRTKEVAPGTKSK